MPKNTTKLLNELVLQSGVPFAGDYESMNNLAILMQREAEQSPTDNGHKSQLEQTKAKLMIPLLRCKIPEREILLEELDKKNMQLTEMRLALNGLIDETMSNEKGLPEAGNDPFPEKINNMELEISALETSIAKTRKDLEMSNVEYTEWQITMLLQFEQEHPGLPESQWIEFLLQKSKSYLPEKYRTKNEANCVAASKFPSSEQQHETEFAHFDQGMRAASRLLAVNAHAKSAKFGGRAARPLTTDMKNSQSWLNLVLTSGVRHIVALGENPKRVDYTAVSSGVLQTSTKDGIINLSNTSTNIVTNIGYSLFNVVDNASLDSANKSMMKLYKVYEVYKKHTVLVHCDSGVGRTGQVRLLFAMLDELSRDDKLKSQCDDLTASIINQSIDSSKEERIITAIFNKMVDTLNQLRKTRYCIQTESQLTGALTLLLMLIEISNTNKHDNKLLPLPDRLNLIRNYLTDSAEEVELVEPGNSDNESEQTLGSGFVKTSSSGCPKAPGNSARNSTTSPDSGFSGVHRNPSEQSLGGFSAVSEHDPESQCTPPLEELQPPTPFKFFATTHPVSNTPSARSDTTASTTTDTDFSSLGAPIDLRSPGK